jgi:LacI family transcriptional regulator
LRLWVGHVTDHRAVPVVHLAAAAGAVAAMNARPRATLRALADQLGLSVTTVSRALKDGPEVRPDTIARVKAAAELAGYRPDWRAVNLRTGRTGVVAVLFYTPRANDDDVGDSSVASIVQGVCRRLEGQPYLPMVQPFASSEEGMELVRRVIDDGLADGIVLSGTTPQDERVRFMLERRFPFVTFGRTELFTPHPFVDIDNALAAQQAAAWLAAQGRRRIALIDPPVELSFARQRLQGYRRALAEAGLPFDPTLVDNGEISAARGRAAAQRLCAGTIRADGLVCATGVVALGALAGVRALGLAPGRDVALVSRDGARLSDYLHPPLPTCFASLSDLGWRLGDFLLRAIAGEAPETLQCVVETRLILSDEAVGAAPRRSA